MVIICIYCRFARLGESLAIVFCSISSHLAVLKYVCTRGFADEHTGSNFHNISIKLAVDNVECQW